MTPAPLTRLGHALSLALVFGLLAAMVAACGLRPEGEPQEISRDSLPALLFQSGQPSTTTGGPSEAVYVVRSVGEEAELEAVHVSIATGDSPELGVIKALVDYIPSPSRPDLKSLIPRGTVVRSVKRTGNTLDIDLSNLAIEGAGQRLATAQLVFTATNLEGISFARLFVEGKPVAVVTGARTVDPGTAVGRADFPNFDRTTTTTTAAPPATDRLEPTATN